jgi:hypothetical protein
MILIQDLLLNDPADKVPLRAVMDYYKHRVPRCTMDSSLESMFDLFRKGDSHMAFVYMADRKLLPIAPPPQLPTLTSRASEHQFTIATMHDSKNNNLAQINQNTISSINMFFSQANSQMNQRRVEFRDESSYNALIEEAVGILTLENIIEELVQSEIMDEADNKRERRRKSKNTLFFQLF